MKHNHSGLGFVLVAYAIASFAAISALGLVLLDASGRGSEITGFAVLEGSSCHSEGDMACKGFEHYDNSVTMTFENTRKEPVVLYAISLGSCKQSISERVEVGGVGSVGFVPCGTDLPASGRVPFELYTLGVFSGKTTITKGTAVIG